MNDLTLAFPQRMWSNLPKSENDTCVWHAKIAGMILVRQDVSVAPKS